MSRAVFLPTPGDPFLLTLWFKYYKVWQKEIDKLYVYVNTPADKEVVQYIKRLVDSFDNTVFFYSDHQLEHGEVLKRLLNHCREDHIMFVEDDGFIFTPGYVDKYFSLLEAGNYKVIGSPRGSCAQEILDKAREKWNLDYSGWGDKGCNFWPNFFFTSRQLLNMTDKNFGATYWKPGEKIPGIGRFAETDLYSDTLVSASLQLRGIVPKRKILEVPQYHGATDDTKDYVDKTNIWDGECPWLHVGSLSSGFLGLLDPKKNLPDGFRTNDERLELERRICFWDMGLQTAMQNDDLTEVKATYQQALNRLYGHYDIAENSIRARQAMYREVMDQWLPQT